MHILYMSVNTVRCVNWHSAYLTFTRYATDKPNKGFRPKSFFWSPNTCQRFLRHRHFHMPGSHMLRTFKEVSLFCISTRLPSELSGSSNSVRGNNYSFPNLFK